MTIKGLAAREVKTILREKGLERGVAQILETIIEHQTELKQQTLALAQNQNQMMNVIMGVVQGVSGFKDAVESANLKERDDHGLGSSTTGLMDDSKG